MHCTPHLSGGLGKISFLPIMLGPGASAQSGLSVGLVVSDRCECRRAQKQLIWPQALEMRAGFLFPYDYTSSGTDMCSG